jgi:7-cyano-7-deazaguanine synthase
MKNKQALLLLSGGIDSTTLLAKLANENFEVFAISFNYGQKHKIELEYAIQNAKKYKIATHHIIKLDKFLFNSSALVNKKIDITAYEVNQLPKGQVNAYVPFRNLLFISTALSLAESMKINEIYLALNKEDEANFWDCKTDFVEKINSIASSHSSIKIRTPFINLSKTDIIKLAKQLKVDINNTISCYQPKGNLECGICLSCMTKQRAIKNT